MTERDIMHDRGTHWVGRTGRVGWMDASYTVYRTGATHSTPDSSYALTPDGLSLAIARTDYLARRASLTPSEN